MLPDDKIIYEATASRMRFFGLVTTLIGISCAMHGLSEIFAWNGIGFARHFKAMLGLTLSPFIVYFGVFSLGRAKPGRVRLEITSEGVKFQSLRGEKWAHWSSLAPFIVVERNKTVIAKVIGKSASDNVIKDGRFTLSASLLDVDATILQTQLNSARHDAMPG